MESKGTIELGAMESLNVLSKTLAIEIVVDKQGETLVLIQGQRSYSERPIGQAVVSSKQYNNTAVSITGTKGNLR